MAVLEVKGLGKRFKQGAIIEDLSFEVKKGEIMAILGPNGAGKSTTIRSFWAFYILMNASPREIWKWMWVR